jgi:hypothetical protein
VRSASVQEVEIKKRWSVWQDEEECRCLDLGVVNPRWDVSLDVIG